MLVALIIITLVLPMLLMCIFALKESRVIAWVDAGYNIVRPPFYVRLLSLIIVIFVTSPATIQAFADVLTAPNHVIVLGVILSIITLSMWFELTQRTLRWNDAEIYFSTAMLGRGRQGWDNIVRVTIVQNLPTNDKVFEIQFKDKTCMTLFSSREQFAEFLDACSTRWIEIVDRSNDEAVLANS